MNNAKPRKGIVEYFLRVLFGHEANQAAEPTAEPKVNLSAPSETTAQPIPAPAAPIVSEKTSASREMLELLGLKEKKRIQRIGVSGYKIEQETEAEAVQPEMKSKAATTVHSVYSKKMLSEKIKALEKKKGKKLSKKELAKIRKARRQSMKKTHSKPKGEARPGKAAAEKQAAEKTIRAQRAPEAEKQESVRPRVVEMQSIDQSLGEMEEQSYYTKEMMKNLEKEFYKQHVSDQEFRQKMLDYRQQLHYLEVRKKKLGEMKSGGVTRVERQPPVEAGKPSVASAKIDWKQMIESKATGRLNEEKLLELEKRMEEAMEKYRIPKKELEKDIASLSESQLLADFDKLINLLELEYRAKKMKDRPEKKEKVETVEPAGKHSMEEVKAIAIELQKHRIITELDKIMDFVKQLGKANEKEIAKKLGMKRQSVSNWCQILEDSGMVRIDYPPLGDPVVYDKNYIELPKVRK